MSAILGNMENPEEKNGKSPLPVVALDGMKIRSIREEKKLTQLYVASVVGVTTDTISRWENNRYPTVKRENGEKLAAALEVPLTDILLAEEPKFPDVPVSAVARNRGIRMALLGMATFVIIAIAVTLSHKAPAVPAIERKLPVFAAPGEVIPVQLRISRWDSATTGLIIKERLPAGWRLVAALPPASTPRGRSDEVKWLIPSGSGLVTIFYTVQASPAAPLKSTAVFDGEIVARDEGATRKGTCGGDRTIDVAGIHWADRNGDGRIDDDEIMPAYYLTEEMKGLDLDWKTTEMIWSGREYRWDAATRRFVVIK
jgi:transcriptional regulator with XRE-family HTH domain